MPGSVRVVRALLAASLAAVALGQGDGRDGGAHGANKLAGSSSPYLLAHSAQPVHWLPWGEEALALAYEGVGGFSYPLNSVNTILHNTVP